jgi:arylsulfatase A-like enzyme
MVGYDAGQTRCPAADPAGEAIPMPNSHPNVVFICVDQWRGDALGIEGHPAVQTPYLDRLASRGARFQRAYAGVPSCIAARASLMTGLTQGHHGRVGYREGIGWNYPHTLAGELSRGGYQTQAVGKMHVYPARNRIGFDAVELHDGFVHYLRDHAPDQATVDDYLPWLQERAGANTDYFDHGVDCNGIVARPWDKPESWHPTTWAFSQGIRFLKRRDPGNPFFLFLSLHRPHPPYDPPQWAFDQYMAMDLPEPPVGDWAAYFDPWRNDHDPTSPVAHYRREVQRRAQAGYYGHMSHIDHQVNRLLETMQALGLDRDTIVCFTSDHGELMGDHHLYRKTLPYEGSARVPLIVHAPPELGLVPGIAPAGVVELRDIMPTLLDMCGLEVPALVDGKSLLPMMRGEAEGVREWVHGEHLYAGDVSVQYLTDGREKYIWFSGDGHEQLFDLIADPHELHDLARDQACAENVGIWRNRMVRELKDREEGFSDGERLIPGRPAKAVLDHLLEGSAWTGAPGI